jgi:hypothetical protein
MARSIAQIQAAIVAAKNADGTLSGLTSGSMTAIWLLWTYVVAACQWTLENLFDAHKSEVSGIIAAQKPHTLQWYVTMAKAFQYGMALPTDSDVYSVVPPVDLTTLVVQFAAAVELTNLVRIKVAQLSGGVLAPLTAPQLTAFTTYMGRVKDAGVRLQCTSGVADTFQPTMVIYYDPLVLDATGARLDGTAATPVKDAVNAFLDSLPFNGVFILNNFIAAMQAVPGVIIADEVAVQAFYGTVPPVVIAAQYIPDAGYMALDNAWFTANVSYTAYTS